MIAALYPAPLSRRGRPSSLIRLLIAFSTSPIPADLTNSPALNAFVARLVRTGWTIRQAYYRNWTIWRNSGEDPRGLIVLPAERPPSGEDMYAMFVAAEVLKCVTLEWPVDMTLVTRLVPRMAMYSPAGLTDRYRQAERELMRFKVWR